MANKLLLLFLMIIQYYLIHFDTMKLCFCHEQSLMMMNTTTRTTCIEIEREALLNFKRGVSDPSGRLSSWTITQDCCQWTGVFCDAETKHVTTLDLRYNLFDEQMDTTAPLQGNISSSLLHLKYLSYFDLSWNNFSQNPIPNFLGSLQNLRYLNLSAANFSGSVPQTFHNLSNLRYLDLSFMFDLESDLRWLFGLSSLEYLNLRRVNLSESSSYWLEAINTLPHLLELHLQNCYLQNLPHSLPFSINFTSLSVLHLSSNDFKNSTLPQWVFHLIGLKQLDLSWNSLQGVIPYTISELRSLQELYLTYNSLQGVIPDAFSELRALEKLDLSYNDIQGRIPASLGEICNLKELNLEVNSITDITEFLMTLLECPKSNLETLDLFENQLVGSIPTSLGNLSSLVTLILSGDQLEGVITESHLSNLSSLKELSLLGGTSLAFNINCNWIPPFMLTYIEIYSVKLGPKFPKWLKNQTELVGVTLSNTGIVDVIPDWFRDLQFHDLDLSHNQLCGSFPLWSSNTTSLDMSNNMFSGPIPEDIGIRMPNLWRLDISNNILDGGIPLSLANMTDMTHLWMSNNYFSGEIPNIWDKMPLLWVLVMSNNSLVGTIPNSICSSNLFFLGLFGNSLSGEFPSSLRNCTFLQILDIGDNYLFGDFPMWLPESMSLLSILRLRNNSFIGNIPLKLCSFTSLHILDLSKNNLSGPIPPCIGNLTAYKSIDRDYYDGTSLEVITKGRMLLFDELGISLLNSIDLSENNLDGEIPSNITSLSELDTLNLSSNHFTGKIPSDIGSLTYLESLDLSLNQLSGPIPASMVSLTLLNHLNLSHNNLSGHIPTGSQFQSFNDPSIYLGNIGLCGAPLTTTCLHGPTSVTDKIDKNVKESDDDDDRLETLKLFVVGGLGFILGFWGVIGILILKKHWRYALFDFVERIVYKICELFLCT